MGASSARSPSALSVTTALSHSYMRPSRPSRLHPDARSRRCLCVAVSTTSARSLSLLRRYRFGSDSTGPRQRQIASLPFHAMATLRAPDVQATVPTVHLSLSSVGVTAVEKVIRIDVGGQEQLYSARLECVVDLGPRQKGAHMSRFEETVNEAINEVVLGEAGFRAEDLARRVAELVRERQDALRAEVTVAARYPEHKPAPVSGIPTQEIYTLYGSAVASEHGTRRIVGVAAQGMTACPCAQQLVAGSSRARLEEEGFSDEEIEKIFEAVPVATHNQRGLATLKIGCPEDCVVDLDAMTLLAIAEDSMSSEIYELMKRSDEAAVVEKAHRRPRFVEDCVREMIAGVVEHLPALTDEHWVSARQENLETIHQHNVVAERFGLMGEIRGELETGEHLARHTGLDEWLRR